MPMLDHTHDLSDSVIDADLVKIGFCPSCGSTMIILATEDHDIAVAHIETKHLDQMIVDLATIRARLRN